MTPEIVSQLLARMESQPRPLAELHRAAVAAGSAWTQDQVALLLACLGDVTEERGLYCVANKDEKDPVTRALLDAATASPIPALVLVTRLPRGVLSSPAALCEIARNHPGLELMGTNRIRRR